MKTALLFFTTIFLTIFSSTLVFAQGCPDQFNENKLEGQQEVDEFLQLNPDCEYLFELDLTGDVTDISGFASLKSVSYLYVNDCPLLTNLNGFHNIDSIFGNLGFYNTEGITNLCGLDNIKYIGNDLRVVDCISMENLIGLGPVSEILDDIEIEGNINLVSLDGLENITSLASSLRITDNPKLVNCCGVQQLLNAGNPLSSITIENNPSNCSNVDQIVATTCSAPTELCPFSVSTTELIATDIQVFPNPARQFIQLEYTDDLVVNEVSIYDLLGQKHLQTFNPDNTISLANISKGIYVAIFRTNGNAFIKKKIVVQ